MQRRFLHLLADHRGHKALAARVVCGGLHGVGVMLRALADGIDLEAPPSPAPFLWIIFASKNED